MGMSGFYSTADVNCQAGIGVYLRSGSPKNGVTCNGPSDSVLSST